MGTPISSTTYRRGGERPAPGSGWEFGNAGQHAPRRTNSTTPDFETIRDSPDFVALRRRVRSFIFPVGAIFLGWYLGYVLLADYAPEFMSQKIVGDINMGLILGLLQFVSTGALTLLYVRYARKQIDPRVDKIREQTGANHR